MNILKMLNPLPVIDDSDDLDYKNYGHGARYGGMLSSPIGLMWNPLDAVASGIGTLASVSCAFITASEMREEHVCQQGYAECLDEKSDLDFFRQLRVTRNTFNDLLELLEDAYKSPSTSHTPGNCQLLGPKKVLYITLCIAQSTTAHECVQNIIGILCNVAPQYIKWPTGDVATQVEDDFYSLAGFPGVIGAIDGCHINIKAPEDIQSDYIDRTLTHSVNLLAVCTSDKKFSYIQAGYCGSAHDSRVFQSTKLYEIITTNPDSLFPSGTHIIGDSAFSLTNHVMVPFRDTGNLTETQSLFNKKLSQTRYVVENAFAFLKGMKKKGTSLQSSFPGNVKEINEPTQHASE